MEYPRYLAAVEKFFENANLILKRKGDYPDLPSSPSFILIDEARKNYYLMEIAFPPSEPPLSDVFSASVKLYAAERSMDENALAVAAVLGKNLAGSRENIPDEIPQDFTMKLAAVLPDEFAALFTAFLETAKIKYEIVTVKAKFTIYFINSAFYANLEECYRDITSQDKAAEASEDTEDEAFDGFQAHSETAEEAPPPRERGADGEVLEDIAAVEVSVGTDEASLAPTGVSPADTTSPADTDPAPVESAAQTIDDAAEEETPATADITERIPVFSTEESIPQFIGDLEKFHRKSTRTFTFAKLMRHLWSFFVFAPAYLISRLKGYRVPMFIAYWIGGMCVILGAYKPLAYLLKPLSAMVSEELYSAAASLNELHRLSGGMRESVDMWCSSIFGTAFAVNMVLVELVKFAGSVYYLQILLSIGYFLAIIPAWREFGKGMISFLLVFYITFIPFAGLAAIAANRLAVLTFTSTAPIMGGLNLMGSVGCYILIIFSAPIAAVILSNCASKSKADVL